MPSFVPPDAHDLIIYRLDEAASPWLNSGAAGALNLTAVGSPAPVPIAGLWGNGISCPTASSNRYLTSGDIAGTTVGEFVGNTCTMSCWVYVRGYGSNYNKFFDKPYRPNGAWSSPYHSAVIGLMNSGTGIPNMGLTTADGIYASSGATWTGSAVSLNAWHQLAWTYDGAVLRLFGDGVQHGSIAATGNIDWGTHGPWSIGGNYEGAESSNAIVDECRFANVTRPQAWFDAWFQTAPSVSAPPSVVAAATAPTRDRRSFPGGDAIDITLGSRNPIGGFNFVLGPDGDVSFDDSEAHAVMTSLEEHRGGYPEDETHGSELFRLRNLSARTPSQAVSMAHDALRLLEDAGLIANVDIKARVGLGNRLLLDVYWTTSKGQPQSSTVEA